MIYTYLTYVLELQHLVLRGKKWYSPVEGICGGQLQPQPLIMDYKQKDDAWVEEDVVQVNEGPRVLVE